MNEDENIADGAINLLFSILSQVNEVKNKIDPEVKELMLESASSAISSAKNLLDALDVLVEQLKAITNNDDSEINDIEIQERALTLTRWLDMKDVIVQTSRDLIKHNPDVKAIGVGAAGMISHDGRVIYSPNVPAFNIDGGVFIKKELEQVLGIPVNVDNDNNCSGYAEYKFGSVKGENNILAMGLGTGIGGDIDSINGSHVNMAIDNDPTQCGEILDEFSHNIALGLSSLDTILNFGICVISGGVSDLGSNLLERVNHAFSMVAQGSTRRILPEIRLAHFKSNAGVVGAGSLALDMMI